MKFLLSIVLASAMTGPAYSCTEDGTSGFLPENDMYIPADAKLRTGITEAQFNSVIDKVGAIYIPIAKGMGGDLKIHRKWKDGTVNASAARMFSAWNVNMFGGLARHATITEDGFALVLCHEIGHQLGGSPKVGNFLMKWAANEGQSDYFATLKCLRKAFLNDNNAAVVSKMKIPATLADACSRAHADKNDMNICIRNGMAGASVSALFASMRNKPQASFDTPDPKNVVSTNHAHPDFQCRLDTYFQGALCEKSFNEDVSQKDEVEGTCHGSTGHTVGLRPRCWFKPKI